ncbi:MAG TPA: FecR domain-containing protein [Gemmatimonadaceae bacterium]|nr:FecR domain-containing protein [Gemmatimonadaceae bacterium]
MDELILAALQDEITPADAVRLDVWRRASPLHETHYQAMTRLWATAHRDDPLAPRASTAPSLAELRARRPRPTPAADPRPRLVWPRWVALATAAAALLFLVGRWSGRPASAWDAGLSASEFVTDTAEMVTARLGDGSVVRLAPRSRLRVAPVAERREVWLDGEAFFAVRRDTTRPFAVRTRAGTVEVLGTRFDLRVGGSELRLVVTEGEVALLSGTHRQIVMAGQVARVHAGGVPVVDTVTEVDSLLAWRRGFLGFENTPLHQAARELERHYGVRVILPDSAIASRTVTAWFTNQSFDQALSAICRAVDAHCTLHDSVASIEP